MEILFALASAVNVDASDLAAALRAAMADDGPGIGNVVDDDPEPPPFSRVLARGKDKPPRLAQEIMHNILRNYESASSYVRSLQFKKERNFHEARRLAQVIDSARSVHTDLSLDFMEMLLRNFAGVCEVDKYNNPGLLEQIEYAPPQQLIPRDFFRAFAKDAKRDANMKKSSTTTDRGTPDGDSTRGGAT